MLPPLFFSFFFCLRYTHYYAETLTRLVLSNASQVANIVSNSLSENFSACITLTEAINASVALPRKYES